jgi:hypothetical protein
VKVCWVIRHIGAVSRVYVLVDEWQNSLLYVCDTGKWEGRFVL